MKFKESNNPVVADLTKSYRKRSINLDTLKAIVVELPGHAKPERRCAWCAEVKLNHGNRKYCSEVCSESAMAWAYPQKEFAIYFLLVRQDWKCNMCQYPYPAITETNRWYAVGRLKRRVLPERKPEVDHIIPISKGGESIGLANHQVICYTCHKAKTKVDNSGPRKK